MRSDIARLLVDRRYDALVATGGNQDPNLFYLMNGAQIHEGAIVIQKQGQDPVLCHGSMERGEAKKSGLRTRNLGDYDVRRLLSEEQGDWLRARVRFLQQLFADEAVEGRVVFYGRSDQGAAYALLSALQASTSNLEVVGEYDRNLIAQARRTKSQDELAAIRQVSEACGRVIDKVRVLLAESPRTVEFVLDTDGDPLRIGEVRRRIRTWLLDEGLEDTGTIFAQGADAGLPHSRGDDTAPVRLGEPIVFDIFPRPVGGGYHTDITRTWCVGPAPTSLLEAYQTVLEAYRASTAALKLEGRCADYQRLVCDIFERQGHPTSRSHPTTQVGYVHSLGHGVGLEVHEEPRLSDFAGNDDVLETGSVFSIEPGLYYPESRVGVRLEDTWCIDASGQPINLSASSLDLEI
jgi:Xaa-Pro aminopeptidase